MRAWIKAESSAKTAADYVNSIIEECQSLATHPHRGRRRDDIRPGMRILGFRRRVVIAFSIEDDIVAILGVFYGGQDWTSHFQ